MAEDALITYHGDKENYKEFEIVLFHNNRNAVIYRTEESIACGWPFGCHLYQQNFIPIFLYKVCTKKSVVDLLKMGKSYAFKTFAIGSGSAVINDLFELSKSTKWNNDLQNSLFQ